MGRQSAACSRASLRNSPSSSSQLLPAGTGTRCTAKPRCKGSASGFLRAGLAVLDDEARQHFGARFLLLDGIQADEVGVQAAAGDAHAHVAAAIAAAVLEVRVFGDALVYQLL